METRLVDIAVRTFSEHGGILRTKRAMDLGIHPRTLYAMRDQGILKELSRGAYRLAALPDLEDFDLAVVALRVPRAIVCLVSALAYHDITTEVPHEVQIALPRGTSTPVLHHPPIRVFRLSGPAFTEGVQKVQINGLTLQIYSPEKTVADCFRFRGKLGVGVAIEALNLCMKRKHSRPAELLRYARICHVEKIMMPYLEARA